MTRWARAGSTQKHKKMPEDPTPWEEFKTMQQKAPLKKEKKFLTNKVKKVGSEAASTTLKKKLKQQLKKIKVRETQHESAPLIEDNHNEVSFASKAQTSKLEYKSQVNTTDGLKEYEGPELCVKKKRSKNALKFSSEEGGVLNTLSGKFKTSKRKCSSIKTYKGSENENLCADETNVIGSHKSEKHKSGKQRSLGNLDAGYSQSDSSLISNNSESEVDNLESDFSSKQVVSSELHLLGEENHLKQKKSKSFFDKVKEKRAQNGITLLPKDVERRLYRLKKSLRARGISGEHIKEMVRSARRKAELNYRRTLKTCFNCRETGHVFANCPKTAGDSEQGTGICFKCGSAEHASFKCHIKTSEFPFAKCFICHNSGHLSRNCPENEHGIYPKGGKCNLCGSVYHLRKDCPKSSKKKDGGEETEITADVVNELRSVDDEIVEMGAKTFKKKRPKLVKF